MVEVTKTLHMYCRRRVLCGNRGLPFFYLQALELLPGDTHITALYPFLQAVLQGTSKKRRQDQLIKNLRKAEHLQAC